MCMNVYHNFRNTVHRSERLAHVQFSTGQHDFYKNNSLADYLQIIYDCSCFIHFGSVYLWMKPSCLWPCGQQVVTLAALANSHLDTWSLNSGRPFKKCIYVHMYIINIFALRRRATICGFAAEKCMQISTSHTHTHTHPHAYSSISAAVKVISDFIELAKRCKFWRHNCCKWWHVRIHWQWALSASFN